MSDDAAPDDGTHRLVDIVVEEVSLVDRAANKRRFLVIKRDGVSDMTDTNDREPNASDATKAALGTLEEIAKSVALLADEVKTDEDAARLVVMADEVAALAKTVLAPKDAAATSDEPDDEEDEDEPTSDAGKAAGDKPDDDDEAADAASAENEEGDAASEEDEEDETKASKVLADGFSALEQRLTDARAAAQKARRSGPRAPAGGAGDPRLDALIGAIEKLTGEVAAQNQRLGRLEKGVGLPSSQRPEQRGRPRSSEAAVSWPLDLNVRVDRAGVDKAVSFHDD